MTTLTDDTRTLDRSSIEEQWDGARIVRGKARARFFTGHGVEYLPVRVDIDAGTVRVWDAIAGYYTSCHSLPAGEVRHLLRLAREAAAAPWMVQS